MRSKSFVGDVWPMCIQYVFNVYCISNVYPMCIQCAFNVHSMWIQCAPCMQGISNVYSMYIQRVSNVYPMCIQCVSNVYSICIQYESNMNWIWTESDIDATSYYRLTLLISKESTFIKREQNKVPRYSKRILLVLLEFDTERTYSHTQSQTPLLDPRALQSNAGVKKSFY